MALLGIYGFDDTATPEPGMTVGSNLSRTAAAARTGPAGLSCAGASTSSNSAVQAQIANPPVASLIFGGAFRTSAITGTVLPMGFDTGGLIQLVMYATAPGALQLRLAGPGGALVADTTPNVIPLNTWTYIEVKLAISNTAGSAEIRFNGTTVASVTGVKTQAQTASTVDMVWLSGMSATNNSGAWDDCYLLDTTGAAPFNNYLGDIAVATLLPTGNGDTSGWLGSDGNSTDNYALVDETPASATDYVGSAASGATDLYQMSDVDPNYTVLATQTMPYLGASDTGTAPIVLPVIKTPTGTVKAGAALAGLSSSYGYRNGDLRTVDPDGNPWTAAVLNGIQSGVRIQ